MSNLGKYARVGNAREIVWEILRREDSWSLRPFTMREFYEHHRAELKPALSSLRPGASAEGMVKGALQSLTKKGLVNVFRTAGELRYSKNMYKVESSLAKFNYGRAMVEAQRLRLL